MEKATIVIVDDHKIVIEGIKSVLRGDPNLIVVGEALNGREAVKIVRSILPNIVIMDICMPELNGIDAVLQIKKIQPNTGIIIYSMYSNREYVVELFKSGITAYILKEDPLSELILAIKAAECGGTYFSAAVQSILSSQMKDLEGAKENIADDLFSRLTLREREVFQLLVEGKTIKDVAQRLVISPKTVETHKYRIMEKLDAPTMNELTKIAIKKKIIHI